MVYNQLDQGIRTLNAASTMLFVWLLTSLKACAHLSFLHINLRTYSWKFVPLGTAAYLIIRNSDTIHYGTGRKETFQHVCRSTINSFYRSAASGSLRLFILTWIDESSLSTDMYGYVYNIHNYVEWVKTYYVVYLSVKNNCMYMGISTEKPV